MQPMLRCLAVAAVVVGGAMAPAAALAVDPGSELITCDRADDRIRIDVSSHLDPSCVWTRGVEIIASNVTLDCQGARIAAPDRRFGVAILAPIDVVISNVTVRNCEVEGFLNNLHIEREGFFALDDVPEAEAYQHAWSNILIEDNTFLNSRGVGVFVDGFVTGVTLRRNRIEGSGSTGIYLEAGSKDNVVEDNDIVDNGYNENSPEGRPFNFAGLSFWFWGTGREGLAIDGSRNNVVRNNRFSGNSAGAIFLYKNCGEFVNTRPDNWWTRLYGADGNVIENNTIVGEDNGVWIGSRMGENTLPMDCSDPQYMPGVSLDDADDNTVRGNVFENVPLGIRVEDDGSVIEDNEFTSDDPADIAVLVGTRFRTPTLGLPVDRTTITGNRAEIAGNTNPYRWIHGHTNTVFTDNRSFGRPVGWCQGVQPRPNPFVMAVAFVAWDPATPPPPGPPVIPPPDPLPPCALGCAAGQTLTRPNLVVRNLRTPPGDEVLLFDGELNLAQPFDPSLDPSVHGVAIVVTDATGADVLRVTTPGGAYDRVTRVGWQTQRNGNAWTYVNRSASPPGGITRIQVKHFAVNHPGRVRFRARGERTTYPVDPFVPSQLPLSAFMTLDPPTAETGQCGVATFASGSARCTSNGLMVRCR